MADEFPQFPNIVPIDSYHAWTASYDSFDERKLDLYYIVTLYESDRAARQFMACIFPWWSAEHWSDSIYRNHLQDAIHAVAVTGQTNTGYQGSIFGWHPAA
jgi:hypothetical protein